MTTTAKLENSKSLSAIAEIMKIIWARSLLHRPLVATFDRRAEAEEQQPSFKGGRRRGIDEAAGVEAHPRRCRVFPLISKELTGGLKGPLWGGFMKLQDFHCMHSVPYEIGISEESGPVAEFIVLVTGMERGGEEHEIQK
ncbi:hypothetical protein CRG98_045607 [Punica granatum]|uniref:Uncharacterized protein n=1 Tax=Punica granatum TaxID=22663 RepID=A0A2I0HQK8_PUNGR|nr:hypothetical protein CRG98_045607 [Punica granatum]